ncbi:SMI1/KNR4 family protein [Actinoplanes sp. NPDC049265]|uniref:SMI1/KNR4 family protein n=1 Tax=Actinoplanes sp. NPDC049265 TaxID=3363902 RepID=UPI00371023C0
MGQLADVQRSWSRIVKWLADNCPDDFAGLQGPAPAEQLDVIEQVLGRPLPADQRAWWRLADGTDEGGTAVWLIPVAWTPLSTRDALARYQGMLKFVADEPKLAHRRAEPAGSPHSWTWLPEWFPIAHNLGGDYLFLDLRPGPKSGCVGMHRKDEWNYDGPIWPNVTAMLSDVADALIDGTEIKRRRPIVENGRLNWSLTG